jgi:hypothetical protein
LKILKLALSGWQTEQAFPEWRPEAIGKSTWLKTPWVKDVSVTRWQESQVVGKPAAI